MGDVIFYGAARAPRGCPVSAIWLGREGAAVKLTAHTQRGKAVFVLADTDEAERLSASLRDGRSISEPAK